jgi:hypothetical protein
MTAFETDEALVVLNVPPQLEEAVVDWLLERVGGAGFTSYKVSGHTTRHEDLSTAEQVSGRQQRQLFQVQIGADVVQGFLSDASDTLGTADIHYWVLPVMQTGRLGGSAR